MAEAGEEMRVGPLAQLPSGMAVIVNCAPLGRADCDALIEASLHHGAHYVDACGEQSLIAHILERHQEGALRAGRCVVPALGLDYAVGDCLARLAAGGACSDLIIAYAFSGRQAGGNSLQFATSARRGAEVVFRGGRRGPVPLELDSGRFDFPAPWGRQRVGRYGAGEVITVPRHTRTTNIRTLITASALVPHPVLLPLFPILRPLVALVLRTPLRGLVGLVGRWLGGLRAPRQEDTKPAGGPAFVVVVEAFEGPRKLARLWATGNDCHQTTAEVLVHGAEYLAGGRATQCGALPPALALPPREFLNGLKSLRWGE